MMYAFGVVICHRNSRRADESACDTVAYFGDGGLWLVVQHADARPIRLRVPANALGGDPYPASYDAEIADPDVHRVLLANLQNSPSAGAAYDPQHQPHSVALLPN
jgi:hypothetical protein